MLSSGPVPCQGECPIGHLVLHELQSVSLEKNHSLVTNWDYYLLDVILGAQLKFRLFNL